ncbi:Na(+)/H(+) antiporter subunit B [Rossellomorea marisflavi]|jgi:multicomponent Na+:H+ antiporter subunit B|uniref:Monovalent cation/H+ antiporter subunit B n=1 Tax=Rossellomorea marisflavi TaxID=189381 RepID=A0A0M0G3C5_9BACI|nr:Na(+)/H(+) antiporter subunit B [Rossellomorea marisflavi]KQU57953.1 cation:proton antiporter [Bacillus sp. Leaf406]VXC03543.1 Na+/H+ antiporter complex [Bacillus sp. 349Y]KON83946.1 monovalent cation/H+ antiporter subunit B [Rossellomorea marisflavi]MDR4935753.1 Na(+)/H(+) antiporter subunit B [Rossellomorea marisflavi]MDW4527855.1 Na(+)/H(+) antiporter subunit B [Rossellomorea marisflavi]
MKTNDVILQTVTKVTVFIIILFSLRLFFSGHYTPGGGFIGGLMTAGALVLLLLAFDLKTVANILPIDYKIVTAIGLLFAIGTAAGALLFNVPFLTHAFDYFTLPIIGKTSLHTAVLFDTGVYLVVVGVTMTIIQTIGVSD